MKKISFLIAVSVLMLAAQAQTKSTPVVSYKVETSKSVVAWKGKKVGGAHNGKVSITDGSWSMIKGNIKDGSFNIDMNSITCDDIKDSKSNADLIGHLKADDFFGTGTHPNAKLDILSSKPLGNGKFEVSGNLTIKGISNPTSFKASVISSDSKSIKLTSKIVFDRTKYDIKYGSTLFGAAIDKAIEDNVTLDIVLVGAK